MRRTKCDGCFYSRGKSKDICIFRQNHKIRYCPCTICLVKVTCITACNERHESVNNSNPEFIRLNNAWGDVLS